VSVDGRVGLSACMSQDWNVTSKLYSVFFMLSVDVTWSSFVVVEIHDVFPVLWMMPFFSHNEPYDAGDTCKL